MGEDSRQTLLGDGVQVTENKKKSKLKKYNVTYHKTQIRVPYPCNPRKGKCAACGRERGKGIKMTALHHFLYAFSTKAVKKNPLLALKNTLEACFPCHRIADGFRALLDKTSIERMMMVAVHLPAVQLDKLAIFCKEFLRWYRNE